MADINNPCDFGTPQTCGVNPAFQYTRYPCDFDDDRPTDARGITIVVDLQTPVIGEIANRQSEAILAIEAELGIQPSGTFTTVRHRLDHLDQLLCTIWQNLGSVSIQLNGVEILDSANTLNFTGNVTVTQTGSGSANINIIGGDGYAPRHEQLTVTMVNQTIFTLTEEPDDISTVLMWLGGIKREIGSYSVSGTTLTYTGAEPILIGDIVEVLYFKAPTGGSSPTPGIVNFTQEVFTATAAQTNFVLSNAPTNQNSVQMSIDGVDQTVGIDFTLSGSTVTYDDNPSLDGETVVIKYFY